VLDKNSGDLPHQGSWGMWKWHTNRSSPATCWCGSRRWGTDEDLAPPRMVVKDLAPPLLILLSMLWCALWIWG
jgi:hypothetical protein